MAALDDDIRPIVRRLGKQPEDFRRAGSIQLCLADGIRVVNLA